ncbi:uncharacterized protein LOC110454897 [Mizuhopecten yessoensis]|uniref:uncharacterized protein LOC110454897 n=1 Tax=Mizuhopecten yessoensis TaxID=6573 RepID=UPI000B45772F|nr:uncharacterized protein LOC110454897 [Mizuhopecten yessoensis]
MDIQAKGIKAEPSLTGSTRTIEDYVMNIVKNLKNLEYSSLLDVHETLQKMKTSMKSKHELNYWKVLQCLGEMSVDYFVRTLILNEKASCKCHTYSNLFCLMQLFVQLQVNVAVIKRQLTYKGQLIPVFFKALRQKEDPSLVREGLIGMYRLLIVGRGELVEIYMNNRILMDFQAQIKCRFSSVGIHSLHAVAYCSELMYVMAVHGTPKTRRIIKNSPALRVLKDYCTKLKKEIKDHELPDMYKILDNHESIIGVVTDEYEAEEMAETWKPKVILKEELENGFEFAKDLIFCSSPACRKQYTEGVDKQFRYCGACRLSRYCSEACQKEHWRKSHKTSCLQNPQEEPL